jgi:hypothetical protein
MKHDCADEKDREWAVLEKFECVRERGWALTDIRPTRRVVIVNAATKKNMPRLEMKYPMSPMDTAATTLPAELNVWLRPWRRSNSFRPTNPSEMAHIVGPNTLDAMPIKV